MKKKRKGKKKKKDHLLMNFPYMSHQLSVLTLDLLNLFQLHAWSLVVIDSEKLEGINLDHKYFFFLEKMF